MKRQMKKCLFLLLSLVLLLSVCPMTALALDPEELPILTPEAPILSTIVASGEFGENLAWTLDKAGTLTISGTGAMNNWSSPSAVPWYSHKSEIKTVRVENGVTSVGSYAFLSSSLTDLYYTGSEAQWNAISKSEDAIPDGVTIHFNDEPGTPVGTVTDFVSRLYTVCLDREGSAAEVSNWATLLKNKETSGAYVAYGFFFSDEFKAKYLCDRCFMEYMYEAVLGREADEAGLNEWLDKLADNVSREDAFRSFIESNEFRSLCAAYGVEPGNAVDIPSGSTCAVGICSKATGPNDPDHVSGEKSEDFLKRLYRVCMGREAGVDDLAFWQPKMQSRLASGTVVAYQFATSVEFTAKELSNGEFVKALYNAFMNRTPSTEEVAFWTGLLDGGTSREDVCKSMLTSAEFEGLCRTYRIIQGSISELK